MSVPAMLSISGLICSSFNPEVMSEISSSATVLLPCSSCLSRWRSRLVCWPKQRSQMWHLNGFSLLWMFRTWRWRLLEIENDLSQYLHLYGCSPVCVLKCLVKFADRGNTCNKHIFNLQFWFDTNILFYIDGSCSLLNDSLFWADNSQFILLQRITNALSFTATNITLFHIL